MKIKYKGFDIDVHRSKTLGGWSSLFYSVLTPDGYELVSSFEDSKETIRNKINDLKLVVDDYLENPEEYE